MTIPLTETIALALSQLFADAKTGEYQEPSQSDIEFHIKKAGLIDIDPRKDGATVGKVKRVRAVLVWAVENDLSRGVRLLEGLLSALRCLVPRCAGMGQR